MSWETNFRFGSLKLNFYFNGTITIGTLKNRPFKINKNKYV
jgi:hypothetical protein